MIFSCKNLCYSGRYCSRSQINRKTSLFPRFISTVCSYRSFNYWLSKSFWSFVLLKAIEEISLLFSSKSEKEKKITIKRANTKNKAKKIKSDNFTWGNRGKGTWYVWQHHNYFAFLGAPIIFCRLYVCMCVFYEKRKKG